MSIKVRTLRRTNRRFIEVQWMDPVTGKKKTRSTKTTVQRDADRFAARLEDQLNGEGLQEPTRTTWDQLWKRYEADVCSAQAPNTADKVRTAVNALVRIVNPKMAAALTTDVLVRFASSLRAEELAPSTIKGYVAEVGRILRWGDRLGLIARAPRIEIPKGSAGMKGRPITAEEYDRLVAKIPDVCQAEGVASWERLLKGLWVSGLRLEEAMKLHWTSDEHIAVDTTSGKYVMLRIQFHAQKSRRFELLPIDPEFAKFLLETEPKDRKGFVFNPRPLKVPFEVRPSAEWVGKIISRLGKKAGVKVNGTKFASAHDFRRAFGTRLSLDVMPAVLQALMRHKSIQTTMQFYVGRNAESIADQVWKSRSGNTSGNTSPKPAPDPSTSTTETAENQAVSE